MHQPKRKNRSPIPRPARSAPWAGEVSRDRAPAYVRIHAQGHAVSCAPTSLATPGVRLEIPATDQSVQARHFNSHARAHNLVQVYDDSVNRYVPVSAGLGR